MRQSVVFSPSVASAPETGDELGARSASRVLSRIDDSVVRLLIHASSPVCAPRHGTSMLRLLCTLLNAQACCIDWLSSTDAVSATDS
jgi:hypothetical protein